MPDFLAVIPARIGSTRLKRKNLRCLGGKPLIRIAVECACNVDALREIVVSSDDEEVLANALWAGEGDTRVTIHRRSPELSTAEARIEPLLALLMRERPWATHVVLLNPTSPFREPATIARCIGAIANLGQDSCCTATMTCLPFYAWKRKVHELEDGESPWEHPFAPHVLGWPRSQDVGKVPLLHGACMVASRLLVDAGLLCDRRTYCVTTDSVEAEDIDTEEDLARVRGLWDAFVTGRGV